MNSLHDQVKKRAQNGGVSLSGLKPNSRAIAQRMIEKGELIKDGLIYRWHEARQVK